MVEGLMQRMQREDMSISGRRVGSTRGPFLQFQTVLMSNTGRSRDHGWTLSLVLGR
jgi:hypothetical protein